MTQLFLTEEQTRVFTESTTGVHICDPKGKVLASIASLQDPPEEIAEARRRLAAGGPRYTSAQVHSRLAALEKEWERTGGFDLDYMRSFLDRLRRQSAKEVTVYRLGVIVALILAM